jgi:hypothetical protein
MSNGTRLSREAAESVRKAEGSRAEIFERLTEDGWRLGQLLILIDKGKTAEVAKQIFERHFSVESVSVRIDKGANVYAEVYYKDSPYLHGIIEDIRSMPHIASVQFYEIVSILHTRPLIEVLDANL